MARWKIQIIFLEKTATGGKGRPVASSDPFVIEADNQADAVEEADEQFNASPRISHDGTYRADGDYIRYANIERLD